MTLAEAIETIKRYCKITDCSDCIFFEDIYGCNIRAYDPALWETPTETNIYDSEEIKEEREKREKEEE